MAPEQTGRVNRSIDSRSDLYSLGVMFYEMLTGSLPFTAVIASATVVPASKPGKRRRLSKEARERIAAAQRKRWAAVKKAAKPTPAKKATAAKKAAVEKAPAVKAKNAAPKKATAAPTEAAQS